MITYIVPYKTLKFIADTKELQVMYEIRDGIVTFSIIQSGVAFISRVKYEDTEEFKITFLDKALPVDEMLIDSLLLREIRNKLDEIKFIEEVESKPELPSLEDYDSKPEIPEPKVINKK